MPSRWVDTRGPGSAGRGNALPFALSFAADPQAAPRTVYLKGKNKHRPREVTQARRKRDPGGGALLQALGVSAVGCVGPASSSVTPTAPRELRCFPAGFHRHGFLVGKRGSEVGRASISESELGGGTVRAPGTCENLDSPHVQPGWWAAPKPRSPSSVSAAPSVVSRTRRALPLRGHALLDGSAWL